MQGVNAYRSLATSGKGGWFADFLSTLSYVHAGTTTSTGFTATPPFYMEASVWLPPLSSCDPSNAAGLWPSISLYTDPSVASPVILGPSTEIDLFELYSVDYTKLHVSWHDWNNGAQTSAGGTTVTITNPSASWHIFGLWVDTVTTHWYLDGAEVFNAPTQIKSPYYILIANAFGGPGWPISLAPSSVYPYRVGYVACWTH